MTLNLTDLISAPSRGTTADAMTYAKRQGAKRQAFLADYFSELWRLCKVNGFDFSILVAQSDNETDSWRSAIWQQYGNPAGLAVTNSQNLSVVYQSGTDAARAHVVHMWAYRYGRVPKGSELANYTDLDGHYDAVFTTNDTRGNPLAASVRTIADFNVNGRWALLDRSNTPTGPLDDYGNRIVQNGRAVWPNLPDQSPSVTTPSTDPEPIPGEGEPMATVTFGKVPRPAFTNREIPTSQNTAFDYLGQREVRGIFLHRMEGSLWGTDEYFRTMANAAKTRQGGLTDFGTDATTGEALMWCNSSGTKSPWASGPVQNPIKSAAIFVNLYGRNAVNQYAESIETSGWGDDAVSAKWRAWVVAEIAYQADDYGRKLAAKGEKFDYTTYPNIPSEQNREFVMSHGWSYDGKRNTCAGSVIEALIPTINKEVKAILTAAQSSGVTPEPVYAPAHPVSKGSQIINGHQFLAPGGKTFQRDTIPSEWGDGLDNPTGPAIKKGTKITQDQISHYVVGTDEGLATGNLWVVLTGVPGVADGSRVPASALIAA